MLRRHHYSGQLFDGPYPMGDRKVTKGKAHVPNRGLNLHVIGVDLGERICASKSQVFGLQYGRLFGI